jgi:biopolymer transport protein ExbD
MAVTKGSGKFSLRAKIDGKGPLHVAFNAADTGAAHGIIYVHETGGAPAPRPHEVVVKLLRDTISINGKAVAADQLDAQLAAAHAATPDEAVVIAADQSVPLSTLSNVMDACTKAGMTKVRIHQPAVSVNIDKDSAITVNRSKVPMDGLQAVLALAHKLNPTVAIRIEADQSADIKVLTNVIEATRKAGIGRFELQSR